MRAAKVLSPPELEQAFSRFLEDFEGIIRAHVQREVKRRLGSRKRATPRAAKAAAKRATKGGRASKKKATRSRAKPEQLTLFQ